MSHPASRPADVERDQLVDRLLSLARRLDALVIVGNGDLARRVSFRSSNESIILLEGAMGMAAAVATGYVQFSSRPVIVIEGDGNRLLGSPAAEWLATQQGSILHIVFANGIMASSGGQALALDINNVRDSPRYSRITSARDLPALIQSWTRNPVTTFICVREESAILELPARPTRDLYEVVRAIMVRSARRL